MVGLYIGSGLLLTLHQKLRSNASGVYASGSQICHQSTLQMCKLAWTPPLLEKDNSVCNTQVLVIHSIGRKERRSHSCNVRHVVVHMTSKFPRHGLPEVVMYDNGPQYPSGEFRCFVSNNKYVSLEKQLFHLDNFIWHKMIND